MKSRAILLRDFHLWLGKIGKPIKRIDAVGFLIPRRFTQVWFSKKDSMVHADIRLSDLDIELAQTRPAQFKERIVEPVVASIDGVLKAAVPRWEKQHLSRDPNYTKRWMI